MIQRRKICVYSASSKDVDSDYLDAAFALGVELARTGHAGIYGAGRQGLMGNFADGMLHAGGEVTGIIPDFMVERGWCHQGLTEVIVTPTMHERKALMAKMADAVVALPGGCGTLEELLEIITWKQLGLFTKPIIIFNVKGYYNNLIAMLHTAVDGGFMKASHSELWSVADTVPEVLSLLDTLPDMEAEDKY